MAPYGELTLVSEFQVFEPDTVAMLGYVRRRSADANEHDARRDAYQAQRISDGVAASSASGGARSAAAWAAARAHHRAIRGAPVEWTLRTIHRALGYSQRPGPPLATYLVLLVAWTTAHRYLYEVPVVTPPEKVPPHGDWWFTLWHMALLPASFLARLPEGAEPSFPYVLGHYGANAAAFVTLGVPLVFTFIALRHFMTAPSRK